MRANRLLNEEDREGKVIVIIVMMKKGLVDVGNKYKIKSCSHVISF
jgi:hypothetical protein